MSTWLEYNFANPELTKFADKFKYEKPLHMTLIHFPKDTDGYIAKNIIDCVDKWVNFFPKRFWIEPKYDDLSSFSEGALVQEYTVPQKIYDQRLLLLNALYTRGIRFSNDYDWNPHITVGLSQPDIAYVGCTTRVLILNVAFYHSSYINPIKWWLKV